MTPTLDEMAREHSYTDPCVEHTGECLMIAFKAGFRAAIEQAAKMAEAHAKENGPRSRKTMGGWAIAEKIRKLVE